MSDKIELKSQLYSVGHYLLKSTGADFRGDGKLNFSMESLIWRLSKKKAHLNFAISIAVNTEADERKNRAEISKIFSRPLSAEIDRG